MSLFSKPETIILKEEDAATEYLQKLRDLYSSCDHLSTAVKDRIEKEICITQAGIKGEDNIIFELKNSGMDMVVLRDIYLECGDLSAQIDFFVVTPKINFIIECKNLVGDIEIDNKGNFIRSISYGNKKWKEGIYSPVTQNERHLTVLKNLKKENASFIVKASVSLYYERFYKSLVVLANPKTILKDRYAPKEIRSQVIRADRLSETIKKMNDESKESKSSKSDMIKQGERMLARNITDRNSYIERYSNLESMINDDRTKLQEIEKSSKVSLETAELSDVCPRCGGNLVARKGKYGSFIGCSNYPKCRYTEKIKEDK